MTERDALLEKVGDINNEMYNDALWGPVFWLYCTRSALSASVAAAPSGVQNIP